ncbi:YesL family protein [Bacillus alkalicellulosilyticus]|uniref:YesL family protein n=1 Tax=Alkalihalobacterium alkalicellulosilyticum TaxID=1912214 RepID=UPI000996A7A7|nr:YesL family protein [Bacillus alkalicellulosilyticus]
MNVSQIVSSLDYILRWIMQLAVINLLWFYYTLIGLFVGGVFPATVAALGLSRKIIMGEMDVEKRKTFKRIYKEEFLRANLIGWFLTAIGVVLYLNYLAIINSNEELFFVIPFTFYFILLFYLIVVIWIFPLVAHYQTSWFGYIRSAIIIGLTKIHYTLASALVISVVVYFSLDFPGIIPFFSISLIAISCMWIAMQTFGQLDQRSS